MEPGVGIALGGLFLSGAAVLIASLTSRHSSQDNSYSALERRVILCEEDRNRLHQDVASLRESNIWLTQRLSEMSDKLGKL